MNNKKRKLILRIWIIFISIILFILLFLLGLRLPKFFKSIQDKNKVETQSKYQTQYIYDTNKVQNIVRLLTELKTLKQLKNKQQQQEQQKETQPINNLDFFDPEVQNELYHKLSKEIDKVVTPHQQEQFETQSSQIPTQQLNDDNKLIKDIAVVSLATGAVI
ncbi:MAG: hypothetical protein ACQBVK_02445, partial [Candidatus Phytoplasma sp. TWB_XP]